MKRHKIIIVLLVAVLFAAGASGCSQGRWPGVRGSGRVVEKTREVSGFTGVELATLGDLYIEMGDEETLHIEAEDNLIEYLEVKVSGRTLKITNRQGVNLRPTEPVNFYLTAKALDTVLLSGSGNIEAPDFKADRILL